MAMAHQVPNCSAFSSSNVSLPTGYASIGKYVESTATSASSYLNLTIYYSTSDVASINPATLFISKYSNGTWTTNPAAFASSYGVNAANQSVYSNIQNFGSVFVPLGTSNATPPPPPPQPNQSSNNNGGGNVYIPPAGQQPTEPPVVEPQPPGQNVTPPTQPPAGGQTLESATQAIADAEVALNNAVKEGRDISQAVWTISAAKDALTNKNYDEAARLAALAISQIGEKGSSTPSGQIGEPVIPQVIEQNGLPLASVALLAGGAVILALGVGGYLMFFRKSNFCSSCF